MNEEVLVRQRRVLGENHPDTADSRFNIAACAFLRVASRRTRSHEEVTPPAQARLRGEPPKGPTSRRTCQRYLYPHWRQAGWQEGNQEEGSENSNVLLSSRMENRTCVGSDPTRHRRMVISARLPAPRGITTRPAKSGLTVGSPASASALSHLRKRTQPRDLGFAAEHDRFSHRLPITPQPHTELLAREPSRFCSLTVPDAHERATTVRAAT
jgi:hypothetical protein